MRKLFLDTDVILDLLLDRPPFSADTARLFKYAITKKVNLFTSPVCIANIHYIISKIENKGRADAEIKRVLKQVRINDIGQTVIDDAVASNFSDFEDSIQNFCAIRDKHTILITRNTRDYRESRLSILTPAEYLASIQS
ncbi:MAG: PIN domain-containing protein [Bacteroidota bacterium]